MVKTGKFAPDKGHTVNEPKDLNIEERARYYRAHINDKLQKFGGHDALNELGDKETAAAIADVVFQFSPNGARTIFTMALGLKPESEEKPDAKKTWDTLVAKTKDPNDRLELRKNIARAREEHAPGIAKRGKKFFGIDRYTHFVNYCY